MQRGRYVLGHPFPVSEANESGKGTGVRLPVGYGAVVVVEPAAGIGQGAKWMRQQELLV